MSKNKKLVYTEMRKPNKNKIKKCDVRYLSHCDRLKIKGRRENGIIELLSFTSLHIIVLCVFIWFFMMIS